MKLNNVFVECREEANSFAKCFHSILVKILPLNKFLLLYNQNVDDKCGWMIYKFNSINVDENEVSIRKLKLKKSARTDNTLPYFIKRMVVQKFITK